MATPAYVFDLDGTVADLSHRLHFIQGESKDWDGFFSKCYDDAPIPHMLDLAAHLATRAAILYVSGRAERCRESTKHWLRTHGAPRGPLYMRKDDDHTPDHELKMILLAKLRADGYEPIMAFDDRTAVVNAWRNAGVPCAQVAAGDF